MDIELIKKYVKQSQDMIDNIKELHDISYSELPEEYMNYIGSLRDNLEVAQGLYTGFAKQVDKHKRTYNLEDLKHTHIIKDREPVDYMVFTPKRIGNLFSGRTPKICNEHKDTKDFNGGHVAKVASEWWKNILQHPVDVTGEEYPKAKYTFSPIAEKQLVMLEITINNYIVDNLPLTNKLVLEVDYEPQYYFRDIAIDLGIELNRFPFKTIMHISPSHVVVMREGIKVFEYNYLDRK